MAKEHFQDYLLSLTNMVNKSQKYGNQDDSNTRLIYNDVTAIKVILFILVVLVLAYFVVTWGCGSKLFLFLVRLSFFSFFFMAPI